MSRPASCSAGYGLSPATGSVIERWKYSGTISIRPPTLTTSTTSRISNPVLRSISSCVSFMFVQLPLSISRSCDQGWNHGVLRAALDERLRGVPGHDHHSAQVEDATCEPDRIERIGR